MIPPLIRSNESFRHYILKAFMVYWLKERGCFGVRAERRVSGGLIVDVYGVCNDVKTVVEIDLLHVNNAKYAQLKELGYRVIVVTDIPGKVEYADEIYNIYKILLMLLDKLILEIPPPRRNYRKLPDDIKKAIEELDRMELTKAKEILEELA